MLDDLGVAEQKSLRDIAQIDPTNLATTAPSATLRCLIFQAQVTFERLRFCAMKMCGGIQTMLARLDYWKWLDEAFQRHGRSHADDRAGVN
ncbi:MAG: hypothetical protein EOS11_08660 [Mesorhizobium sp.]|uniref:hypothetical protein n=1 Tax=Mesorhizobium sp. TaxID=1871066 RepID=UPI000FE3BAEA|nr:hypothetical protein [Mesorhizobium sp.]RWO33368.1 MAG: hypothetical protein EOS10_06520 [Mesorhizobium sp.]RWO46198.1 MAG: hypothetical protein EOS11_08660 [Mesorhizobium sp.]TIN80486.1 MAG: hypothetical protein E5Y09_01270 [Mesorhizobium sp.]